MTQLWATLGTSWVEAVAVAFGLTSVWLTTRQHIASWPTAIVNVAIYFLIFWQAKLYAASVLQLFFLSISVYGWWAWLHGGAERTPRRVSRATPRLWIIGIPVVVGFGLALGAVLDRTLSPVPYLDAMLTSASLAAQWMMSRKILENWIVWIIADVVYVPMFISRGLHYTAVQYGVFLVLAVIGYNKWKQSMRAA